MLETSDEIREKVKWLKFNEKNIYTIYARCIYDLYAKGVCVLRNKISEHDTWWKYYIRIFYNLITFYLVNVHKEKRMSSYH